MFFNILSRVYHSQRLSRYQHGAKRGRGYRMQPTDQGAAQHPSHELHQALESKYKNRVSIKTSGLKDIERYPSVSFVDDRSR